MSVESTDTKIQSLLRLKLFEYLDGLERRQLPAISRKHCRLYLQKKLTMDLSNYKNDIKQTMIKYREKIKNNDVKILNHITGKKRTLSTPKIAKRRSTRIQNKIINKQNALTPKINKPTSKIPPPTLSLRRSTRIKNKSFTHSKTSSVQEFSLATQTQKSSVVNSPQSFADLTSSFLTMSTNIMPPTQSFGTITLNAPELDGKYKLIGKIDHGGYATVYKAIDLSSNNNNIVAIKRVQTANIKTKHQNHPCIEAKILEEFSSHIHFPTLREILCDCLSGSYSIIMDYFQHDPFEEYNKILNEKDTIQYLYVLLNCIYSLSLKGYVHRDIKPSNFLYSHQQKKYLLIDFGLCQLKSCITNTYEKDRKLRDKYQNKNKNKLRRHSTLTTYKSKIKKNKNKQRRTRRSHVSADNLKEKTLPTYIRDGTPGFRAPEIILASNNQDSRIDVFSVGLILGSIMLGCNIIFNPINDAHQLIQFINVYGLHTVYETANELNRNLEIRGLNINMNNGCHVTGYELTIPNQQRYSYKLSYWIKQRLKCLNDNQGKENVNNYNGNNTKIKREWSDDLYDLLDELTQFNPFKRPTPYKVLQHKLFSCFQRVQGN